jgi:hypothetical protein
MTTIFKRFPQIGGVPPHWTSSCANEHECFEVSPTLIPRLRGYFQTCDGVTEDFKALLDLPAPSALDDDDAMLMHIRGGDFKGNPLHDVNLVHFRKMAVSSSKRKRLLIFTNDREHAANELENLQVPSSFVPEEDELQLLSTLASSTAPLICANSTFSWWVGALSTHTRLVFLPRQWYARAHHHEPEGPLFRLPGAIVL